MNRCNDFICPRVQIAPSYLHNNNDHTYFRNEYQNHHKLQMIDLWGYLAIHYFKLVIGKLEENQRSVICDRNLGVGNLKTKHLDTPNRL